MQPQPVAAITAAEAAPPANPRAEVMNFLNEMAERFPQAISFASGRPAEAFFALDAWLQTVPLFQARIAAERGIDLDAAARNLAQYGPTAGLLGQLISAQLASDEAIDAPPQRIVVTAGCQEALDLCVRSLCRDPEDVLLVRSPTYIGISGAADLAGVTLMPFRAGAGGTLVSELEAAIVRARAQGRRPRALYLIPEFDNPTGEVIALDERKAILALCAYHDVVILEDNPYGMFRYDGERVPSLHALDRDGLVVYVGTYSKTLCPALRVGFAVVPDRLCRGQPLFDALVQAKSFVSVNTSQLTQAVVGGVLLSQGGSLTAHVRAATAHYRANRDAMLAALETEFADCADAVRWNRPEGGFFLVVSLPFAFGQSETQRCARDYGVLVMPLSFFALDCADDCRVRLAFSYAAPERIREGVARFARFVRTCL